MVAHQIKDEFGCHRRRCHDSDADDAQQPTRNPWDDGGAGT